MFCEIVKRSLKVVLLALKTHFLTLKTIMAQWELQLCKFFSFDEAQLWEISGSLFSNAFNFLFYFSDDVKKKQ